jgi:hypothetical protein
MEVEDRRHDLPTQPESEPGGRRKRGRHDAVAFGLALTAIACAVAGAIGPAKALQTQYTWPPQGLSEERRPERLWYTPLLLARHEPQAITARLPCALPPPLPSASRPVTVLATARDPGRAQGLSVLQRGERLIVQAGDRVLTSVSTAASSASDRSCMFELAVEDRRWSLAGGPNALSESGDLDRMPVVTGLFSALDLGFDGGLSARVTTVVHGAETRLHQTLLWLVAGVTALAALLLVSLRRRPEMGSFTRRVRRFASSAGPDDAVVASVLLGWWVIGPAFFDDGWVAARQANYSASGGFSAYFTSFGVNLPLDYWLEWIEHWLVESSSALLVLRIPALICLSATWVLCRWILGRTVGSAQRATTAPRWALVSAFLVWALAWGMTLRPEPTVALLVTGVLACAARFRETRSAPPLALAATLVALALSAHPAGIVSVAPLLALAPSLVRWGRRQLTVVATIVAAAGSLLVTLAVVGSDISLRLADTRSLRMYGDETAGWRDELTRYGLLAQPPYGSPLRREAIALMVLALLAFLLRRRQHHPTPALDLPATTLGLALVLLIATPTKWPWHFGALIGLAALAVAAETGRIQSEAQRSRGWALRPLIVVAAAVVAAAWSWYPRNAWGDLDLITLDWTLAFESRSLTLAKAAAAVPLLAVVTLGLLELRRRGARALHRVPWRTAAWTAPLLALPLVAFTAAVFIADTAKTATWTLARQNLQTLAGRLHCGLADDAVVAAPSSMRPLELADASRPQEARSLPSPPAGLPRYLLGPPSAAQPVRSPWFRLPRDTTVGVYLIGALEASDSLELEWGRARGGSIEVLSAGQVSGVVHEDDQPGLEEWHFFAAGSLPSRPDEATAVRFVLGTGDRPGPVVGLTAPVAYSNERLAGRVEGGSLPTLVLPNLLTYLPCASQPRVSDGVAEVPAQIVAFEGSIWPLGTGTSPFDGVFDLYRLERLPLADSSPVPGDVALYGVRRDIPGAIVAPPTARTLAG